MGRYRTERSTVRPTVIKYMVFFPYVNSNFLPGQVLHFISNPVWNRITKNNTDYGVSIGGEEEYESSDFEKRNKFI